MTEEAKLVELRELAKQATPGPWTFGAQWICRKLGDPRQPGNPDTDYQYLAQVPLNDYDSPRWNADAAFIAACDPQTILSLLDEIERLSNERDAEREACAQIAESFHVEKHEPSRYVPGDDDETLGYFVPPTTRTSGPLPKRIAAAIRARSDALRGKGQG